MATANRIEIDPENTGLWNIKQSKEAAQKATELMQRDLQEHHVYLNMDGFHDHVPHHILALYGTGASPDDIQKAYDMRHPLQRPVQPSHEPVLSDLLQSWDHALKYLGKEEYYPDFLAYFQGNIEARGYEAVVNEYLFKENDAANLLVRLHAGVLHPLIQLMYGLEWKQPAVVAEALAQTCVHDIERLDELLLEGESRANKSSAKMPSLLSMYERIRTDPQLVNAVRFEDKSKIEDGILKRAKEEMLTFLQEIKVRPDELEERTAEMFHTMIFIASGAAIHPPHHVKYDFFLMHHINSSLIYLTINKQPWISERNKIRMLEWKIRMDFIQYVARGSPSFSLKDIASYIPKQKSKGSLKEIAAGLHSFGDDGHAIKQARATSVCYELMKSYEDRDWVILKGDYIWEQVQYMVIDAVEGPGRLYVRTAGLEEAWKAIPHQSEPKRSPEVLRSLLLGQ